MRGTEEPRGKTTKRESADPSIFNGTPAKKGIRFELRAVPSQQLLIGTVRLAGKGEYATISNICEGFSVQIGVARSKEPFFYGSIGEFRSQFFYSPSLDDFLDRPEPQNSRQQGGIYLVPLSEIEIPKRVKDLYDDVHGTLIEILPKAAEEMKRIDIRMEKPNVAASTRQSFRRYPLALESLALDNGFYYRRIIRR
ncbi:hypothetical protein HY638_04745 [Candidatus Woesearchaeota archaeon]|nr:hypothetical protein [Candidatus Woesearchaeota archaeon]